MQHTTCCLMSCQAPIFLLLWLMPLGVGEEGGSLVTKESLRSPQTCSMWARSNFNQPLKLMIQAPSLLTWEISQPIAIVLRAKKLLSDMEIFIATRITAWQQQLLHKGNVRSVCSWISCLSFYLGVVMFPFFVLRGVLFCEKRWQFTQSLGRRRQCHYGDFVHTKPLEFCITEKSNLANWVVSKLEKPFLKPCIALPAIVLTSFF